MNPNDAPCPDPQPVDDSAMVIETTLIARRLVTIPRQTWARVLDDAERMAVGILATRVAKPVQLAPPEAIDPIDARCLHRAAIDAWRANPTDETRASMSRAAWCESVSVRRAAEEREADGKREEGTE